MIKAPKMEGQNLAKAEVLEAGGYPARLVQVVDLGLQKQVYREQVKKPARMIYTTYELNDEFMKDEEGEDVEDKPRWLSEQFALYSLEVDRATSTSRYNALDPTNEFDGDWEQVISAPVTLSIAKYKKQNGEWGNKIDGSSPMRKKDAARMEGLKNDPVVWALEDPSVEVFTKFPNWLQEKIVSNLEFKGSVLQERLDEAGVEYTIKQNKEEDQNDEQDDLDDEIPF